MVPIYLDKHEDTLKGSAHSKEEIGLHVLVLMKVKIENENYCLLKAPDPESIVSLHAREGIRCDWIVEATSLEGIKF